MTAPRFYIDAELAVNRPMVLPESVVHHAVRVLRLRDGAVITLFNGRGGEFEGRLQLEGPRPAATPERFRTIERESPLQVTLVQAWVATDKLEFVIEKSVELGVASILLVPAARSVVQLDGARRERRLERLKDIIIAACCQCGRNRLPGLDATATLREGLAAALEGGRSAGILLDPHDAQPAAAALDGAGPVALAVGPEGGFDDTERGLAAGLGFRPARLGPRVLRTETASLAALAALQALRGDLR